MKGVRCPTGRAAISTEAEASIYAARVRKGARSVQCRYCGGGTSWVWAHPLSDRPRRATGCADRSSQSRWALADRWEHELRPDAQASEPNLLTGRLIISRSQSSRDIHEEKVLTTLRCRLKRRRVTRLAEERDHRTGSNLQA